MRGVCATSGAIAMVVVTYHSADTIDRCLRLLRDCRDVGQIRVVDNHSTDATLDIVQRLQSATGAVITFGPTGGPMALAADLSADAPEGGRVLVSAHTTGVETLSAIVASAHSDSPLLLLRSDRVPAAVKRTLERLAPTEIGLAGTIDGLSPALRAELGELVPASTSEA